MYDAEKDGSEAFIKIKWGLSGDRHDSFDQASGLALVEVLRLEILL